MPDAGPLRAVHGLVADLLSVSVEMAPLIEVALGAAAQHVVAQPGERVAGISRPERLALRRPRGIRVA